MELASEIMLMLKEERWDDAMDRFGSRLWQRDRLAKLLVVEVPDERGGDPQYRFGDIVEFWKLMAVDTGRAVLRASDQESCQP